MHAACIVRKRAESDLCQWSLSERGLKVICVNGDLQDDSIKKRVLHGEYQVVLNVYTRDAVGEKVLEENALLQ